MIFYRLVLQYHFLFKNESLLQERYHLLLSMSYIRSQHIHILSEILYDNYIEQSAIHYCKAILYSNVNLNILMNFIKEKYRLMNIRIRDSSSNSIIVTYLDYSIEE